MASYKSTGCIPVVRHPMYVGVLTLSLGVYVSGNTVLHYLPIAALYALFTYKARYEEQLLIAKYHGYKSYMKRTPRFIPGLSWFSWAVTVYLICAFSEAGKIPKTRINANATANPHMIDGIAAVSMDRLY